MGKSSTFIRQNKKQQRSRVRSCLKYIPHLSLMLIIVIGILFVVSVNDLSIKGFMLKDLKVQLMELKAENEQFELIAMELESYENIENRAQELKMVKVDSIDYITLSEPTMAMR